MCRPKNGHVWNPGLTMQGKEEFGSLSAIGPSHRSCIAWGIQCVVAVEVVVFVVVASERFAGDTAVVVEGVGGAGMGRWLGVLLEGCLPGIVDAVACAVASGTMVGTRLGWVTRCLATA